MMPIRILAAVAFGVSAGACSFTSTTTERAPPPPPPPAATTTTVYSNTASSEQVCLGYGLRPGTADFNRCVTQDMEARARGLAPAPPPAASATVYATPSRTTVTPAATTPPVGVETFRDEYGYRYDGQGNRLDRYGNIISPQSKIP